MAIIDEKKVNMNTLKTNVKALNESGLVETAIPVKGKKLELAAAFVKGIEAINDIGKLDEIPADVFTYYQEIVPPKKDAEATGAADASATGTGRGNKKATKPPAAAPKEKKATRADIFAELVTHKTPYTKEQLVEKMVAKFGGSEPEAAFQIGQMVRTTLSLAAKGVLKAEVNDKKQLVVG
jgi:hypothetical protein